MAWRVASKVVDEKSRHCYGVIDAGSPGRQGTNKSRLEESPGHTLVPIRTTALKPSLLSRNQATNQMEQVSPFGVGTSAQGGRFRALRGAVCPSNRSWFAVAGARSMSEIAFHEMAGRSQVGWFLFSLDKSFLLPSHLPDPACFDSRQRLSSPRRAASCCTVAMIARFSSDVPPWSKDSWCDLCCIAVSVARMRSSIFDQSVSSTASW